MRGVSFFKPLRLSDRLMSPELRETVRSVREKPFPSRENPISFAAFTETPLKRYGPPAAARSQVVFRTPYLDNDFVALCYRAPRPAPGNSADLALQLVRDNNPALASIATDRGYRNGRRTFLRKALAETLFKLDYLHSEGLPRRATPLDSFFRFATSALGIAGQHKFLLYRSWFQRELGGYLDERLADLGRRSSPFWEVSSVKAIFHAHRTGQANYSAEINSVLTLEAVERLLLTSSELEERSATTAPTAAISSS